MIQGNPRGLVKAHEYAELENGPRIPKKSKWIKDAQEEINETKELTSNEMGQEKLKIA